MLWCKGDVASAAATVAANTSDIQKKKKSIPQVNKRIKLNQIKPNQRANKKLTNKIDTWN